MKSIELTRFVKGFISESDLEGTIAPDGSLRDCLNVEINSPLGAITRPFGTDEVASLPLYSGSETIAVKRFSVDTPSSKEISVLIRRSKNLLKYSEDYEITPWTKDAGLTLSVNNLDAPTRRADSFVATSNNDGIEQAFPASLAVGTQVTFSIRYSVGSLDDVWQISIIDGAGQTNQTFVPNEEADWLTVSVTRTLASSTGQKVRIQCNTANVGSLNVWGAQLEVGSVASEYGYTNDITKPYYIYINPYYDGAWVVGWRELSEKRSFLVASVGGGASNEITPTGGNVATTIEGNDYFNRWTLYQPGSTPTNYLLNQRIVDYVQSTDVFTAQVAATDYAATEIAVVSRSPIPLDAASGGVLSDKYSANYDSAESAYIYENNGVVTCIFPSETITRYACIIKYVSRVDVLDSTFNYDEFILDKESMSYGDDWYNPPFKIAATGVASGGSLADGTYTVSLVAVLDDGSRILSHTDPATITGGGGSGSVSLVVTCYPMFMSPRVLSVEIYINSGAVVDSIAAYLYATISTTDTTPTWTWVPASGYYSYSPTITAITLTNVTMFENMQRSPTVSTIADYKYKAFVNGRYYVAGMVGKEDSVRFSHIADIVSELSIYPYDSTSTYGEIIAVSGTAERIRGLAKSLTNDLIIFKDKTTLVYEVQSGRTGIKRLYTAFQGIGCATHRGIAETDYGVFWYDTNNIYLYTGGTNEVRRLGTGRVAKYLKSLSTYLPYSFAIFVRGMGEYWIFTQVSGTVGSTTASNYRILRYAVEFDNFNLMQWEYAPKDATETIGSIAEVGTDLYYHKWHSAGATSFIPNGYAETHKLPVGGFVEKLIGIVGMEYSISNDATIALTLNEETTARTGNTLTAKSGWKKMYKQPRMGSSGRFFRLKFQAGAGAFAVKALIAVVSPMKERFPYGR